MGDLNFIKLYVCLHNKWNPYSDESKNIPIHYWYAAFYMIRQQSNMDWKNLLEPQAELIGNLIKPEIYAEYLKIKKRKDVAKNKGTEDNYESTDNAGLSGYATTSSHYDPDRGVIDSSGNVVVPKEKYLEMTEFKGIAVSY